LTSEDVGERLFETDGTKLTRFIDEREDGGWRIEKHRLVVRLQASTKRAAIRDDFTLRADPNSGRLMLRLSPNYRVARLDKAGGTKVDWIQLGGIVFIAGANSGDRLSMDYSAVVDKPGYAGSISEREAMLTNDYWYPMIARKPTPFSIEIHGPSNWELVCNGNLVRSGVTGSEKVTEYDMPVPISYWSLNAGPYKTVSETIQGRKYWVKSSVLSDTQMQIQPKFFPLIIHTFEAFAPFPFEGYGSNMTPTYGGGALEAYSFVTSGYYSGEDSHEIGHTWFGGMVNNTYLKSLWNESFAVWCQGYYGRNAKLGDKSERALAYIQTPEVEPAAYNTAPLADAPAEIGPLATTLGYGKGAYVLQMLEQKIGTAAFVEACREWIKTQDKTKGAEWGDFERAVQKVSKVATKTFFDQWVRRPGFADFDLKNVRFAGGAVVGSAEFHGPAYDIDCEALIGFADGKRQFTTFALKSGQFRIPVSGRPAWISFDPWRRIVRRIEAGEHPASIASQLARLSRVEFGRHVGWLNGLGGSRSTGTSDIANRFLVGLPSDDPRLAPLYKKVGISVQENTLTYKGTRVDLRHGGFVALVESGGGKQCAIGAGTILHDPNFGRARLMVFDELGRFIRGETLPKTQGKFVFQLGNPR
ncbi:MAG TPA: M1 family aminopeptidase, partial [Fimbriimonadaceae bacterium]|nr:M1 family aminopeptidase [Fimbriimonadaceae bacterium]